MPALALYRMANHCLNMPLLGTLRLLASASVPHGFVGNLFKIARYSYIIPQHELFRDSIVFVLSMKDKRRIEPMSVLMQKKEN